MATITVASFLAAAQRLAKVAPPGALISVPDDFGKLQVTDPDGHPFGDVNLALALDRWLAAESSWSTPPGRDLTGPLSIAQPLPVTRPAFVSEDPDAETPSLSLLFDALRRAIAAAGTGGHVELIAAADVITAMPLSSPDARLGDLAGRSGRSWASPSSSTRTGRPGSGSCAVTAT